MARLDTNRSGEMEAFVQVVERGGFSPAARALEMTPSAVSKLVSRLEARLGTQLAHRSTRKLQLTPEGSAFYERSVRVLADMDEAEQCAAVSAAPRGRVSVNANLPFGLQYLIPKVPLFQRAHPDVTLDITLSDRVVDLMDERADVAIRWGRLPASDLVARNLGETSEVIVGSPAYLASHGTPAKPADLQGHDMLGFSFRRRTSDWPLRVKGRLVKVPVSGSVRAGDGESIRELALAGAGLARLSLFHIQRDLAAGRLVPVLEKYNPGEKEPINAVYLGKGGRLPARVRCFLDFLDVHARI
jgi:DNA-binding transcriptional LysR family regulator